MAAMHLGGQSLGLNTRWMESYTPRNDSVLMVYGMGGPDRLPFASKHPGTVIAWDVGYWGREPKESRNYRVSINGLHCPDRIMKGPYPGAERFNASGLNIGKARKVDGPVMLVGNGPKSNAVGAAGWTRAKSKELRALGLKIAYRPKPRRPQEQGVLYWQIAQGDIETELAKVSLVVCRHSNVAVDACRLGVPVVCEDGAAAAIYPNKVGGKQPSDEKRAEFLHRLAWWQWSKIEAKAGLPWKWLEGVL